MAVSYTFTGHVPGILGHGGLDLCASLFAARLDMNDKERAALDPAMAPEDFSHGGVKGPRIEFIAEPGDRMPIGPGSCCSGSHRIRCGQEKPAASRVPARARCSSARAATRRVPGTAVAVLALCRRRSSIPAWRWISGSSASGVCGPQAIYLTGQCGDQDGAQARVRGQEPGSAASPQGTRPPAVGGHLALMKPL